MRFHNRAQEFKHVGGLRRVVDLCVLRPAIDELIDLDVRACCEAGKDLFQDRALHVRLLVGRSVTAWSVTHARAVLVPTGMDGMLRCGDIVVLTQHRNGIPQPLLPSGRTHSATSAHPAVPDPVWYVVVPGQPGRQTPVQRSESVELHDLTSSVVLCAAFRAPKFLHQVYARYGDAIHVVHDSCDAVVTIERAGPSCVPHLICGYGAARFMSEAASFVVDPLSFRRFWAETRCPRVEAVTSLTGVESGTDVGVDDLRTLLFGISCARHNNASMRCGRVLIVSQDPDNAHRIWEQVLGRYGERACVVPMLGYESRFVGRSDVRALAPRFSTYRLMLVDVPTLFVESAKAYACQYWSAHIEDVQEFGSPSAQAALARLVEGSVTGCITGVDAETCDSESSSAALRAETIVGAINPRNTAAMNVRVAFALAELAQEVLAHA